MRNLSRSAPLTGGGTISGDLTVTGDMVVEGGGALSVDQLLEGDFKILTASATAFVVGDISEPANDIFTVDTSTPEITAGAPIVFSSLGEATRAIDLSSSGLSGSGDYWIYGDEDNYWNAQGQLYLKGALRWQGTNYEIVGNDTGNYMRFKAEGVNLIELNNLKAIKQMNSAYITSTTNVLTQVTSAISSLTGNSTAIGSLTDCTSNGTATITKTSHGLSVAAGDLIHITDATTAADEGFYRLVSSAENTLVVDRALSGSDADVDLTVYKDVIGIFATDGTNGQRIMSYSHQDKPLQIGGDVLAATGHSLGAEDVLIGGKAEFDDSVWFDEGLVVRHTGAGGIILTVDGSGMLFEDDMAFSFGASSDATFRWETADANAHALVLALPDGGATNVPVFVIGDKGATSIVNQDLGVFDGVTDPTLAIWDAAGGASKYISFKHDGTDAVISSGAGGIKLSPNAGFSVFGGAVQTQQAHIVDADGTLADITTKFNTLLADLEGYGFLATS